MALVVDDDPVLRTIGAESLAAIGFEILEAETGEAALAACEERTPDLVLLDVKLPGLDGFSTCEAMRRQPALAEVPILIITGRTDSGTIDRTFEVGATDFIGKPLDWQLVQHRVRFLMRANSAFNDLKTTLSDLAESRRGLDAARELGHIGTWELAAESGRMLWSEELQRLLGSVPGDAPTWDGFVARIHPDDRVTVEKAVREVSEASGRAALDHRLLDAEGAVRYVSGYAEALETLPGEHVVRGTLQDVTERRRAEAQVAYLEMFDSLTQLPNRAYLHDRLERLVFRAKRGGPPIAVMCVALDRFERVNQALGHAFGDQLLRAVGERLLESVRTTDFVGRDAEPPEVSRFGGDEFVIVLLGSEPQISARRAASRILQTLAQPFEIGEHSVPLSASIGIALFPEDGSDADALIGHAAAAMSRAKNSGGGSYDFFDPTVNRHAINQLSLESDLAAAIESGGLVLEYQPECDAGTGELVAAEALVRWNHPRLGRLMPVDFIPVAEACGLISALTEWVLREACRQLRSWDASGLTPFGVSVNLSSLQFHHGNVAETVQGILAEAGVDPGRLEVEITESALLGEGEHVLQTCQDLRALGVRLALDDFGTGFSSLSHLFRFQIDTLKIDRYFVAAIRPGDNACGIISAVIAMAKRLHIKVVAEGVENPEQQAFLREEGCDLLQGFGICRPVEPERIESWIRDRS
jgi:diguanylate cyclase (GGDEF)-like protein